MTKTPFQQPLAIALLLVGWLVASVESASAFPCHDENFASEIDLRGNASSSERQRPNILICIADDWSYGHASAYGCDWTRTPGFDAVARRGLLFHNAYTPNAKCAPSRASLLTGRNSWQLKSACNHVCDFPAEFKSFMEVLSENGYAIGHTTKGWGPGRALDEDNQPRQLTGKPFNHRKIRENIAKGISKNDYAANFESFLTTVGKDQPWCFWYGAIEPHRGYQYGVGVRKDGKSTSLIQHVPKFWPDNETIRNDMLDYAHEVEHFDRHVQRMLKHLETSADLENTIVIVTSDHGMPFPRCKGQAYEMSNHIPLALMWPKGLAQPGRTIDDYVSLIDVAPTILEVAGINWAKSGMAPSPGRSLVPLIKSNLSGVVDPQRDFVVIGKERHDIGRPGDVGYPIRGIVRNGKLFLRNYKTDRWPAGDPVTGYLNCDGSPTKTWILNERRRNGASPFWDLCFGKRPEFELYDIQTDPDCVANLANSPAHQDLKELMFRKLDSVLREQEDPRATGLDPDQFDRTPYLSAAHRDFYHRFKSGEKLNAGWVNPSDFEPKPIRENPKR